jgi:hypothetical protein
MRINRGLGGARRARCARSVGCDKRRPHETTAWLWVVVALSAGLVACSDDADDGGAGPSGEAGQGGDAGGGNGGGGDGGTGGSTPQLDAVPRAVEVARATEIPACSVFVDAAANAGEADGSSDRPFVTIAEAVDAASEGGIVCVAEGTYPESLSAGTKGFTLAGGFMSNGGFATRDSAAYVTRVEGTGNDSFVRIEDPGPSGQQLTAIDGFEITGYSQAISRDFYLSQRMDVTNNYIHDNACAQPGMIGAAFSLTNITGTIAGNVIARNTCGRGGGGALVDSTDENSVALVQNRVEENVGDEPGISHGGGFYLFGHELELTGNLFVGNDATGYGGGMMVASSSGAGQLTTARLSWNVYRDNRAGIYGGGFFCDDAATCISDHEIYTQNCGGNIYLDAGGVAPTIASFDHLTNHDALAVGCGEPGPGVLIDKDNTLADTYSFTNAIFWGNAEGRDFGVSCIQGCADAVVTVSYSLVQTDYETAGIEITFGDGIVTPVDPMFVDPAALDFHLRSTHGHWAGDDYVNDEADSPALAAGDPGGSTAEQPDGAGERSEMGAYGNSVEASLVR